MVKKKVLFSCVTLIFIFLSFSAMCGQANGIDVAHNNGVISLEGDWEFYWNEWLLPNDLEKRNHPPSYIQVPGSWKNQSIDGESLTRFGYGTYRTQLEIPAKSIGTQKALSLSYIASAYRLWINGEEYPGLGVVGTNREDEIPQLQNNLIFFEPKEEIVEIVIHVSNYSFREGGMIEEVVYGEQNELIRSNERNTSQMLIIVGGFMIMGLYHLFIFVIRKNELAILSIGIASLALALRTFFRVEHVASSFFPFMNWATMVKIEYLSELMFFLSLVFLIKSLYPKDVHIVMVRFSFIVTLLLFILILVTSPALFTMLLPYHMFVLVLIGIYFVFYVGTVAAIRKREAIILHLTGAFVIIVATINDTLNSVNLINTFHIIEFAFIIFILLQAVIVSNRYTLLFKENITLNDELMALNQSLEEKIEERTKELYQKNEQLEEMQQTRTEMLSNIAHDIGTPLTGVQTYLQIMKEGKININNQPVLPLLIDKVDYIRKLNNDLFELSKLESRQLVIQVEKVKLNGFFSNIYQSLKSEMETENITVYLGQMETKIEGKEVFVRIDTFRIMQVMQNFVVNAVKHNISSKKVITLHCYIYKEKEVVIKVEDNGVGITSDDTPYIFERFYKKSEGHETGSGLGLAIVKEIVEKHGGRVDVDSQIGNGSHFYFTLPVYLE